MGTDMAAILLYDLLEDFHLQHLGPRVWQWIDDLAALLGGSPRYLFEAFPKALRWLQDGLRDLELTLAPKSVLIASSRPLVLKLQRRLREEGVLVTTAAVGADLGLDQACAHKRAKPKQRKRNFLAGERARRAQGLNANKKILQQMWIAGPRAARGYAPRGFGANPTMVLMMRGEYGRTIGPLRREACLTSWIHLGGAALSKKGPAISLPTDFLQ